MHQSGTIHSVLKYCKITFNPELFAGLVQNLPDHTRHSRPDPYSKNMLQFNFWLSYVRKNLQFHLCCIWFTIWICKWHTPWSPQRWWLYWNTQSDEIGFWADIDRNCNTFLMSGRPANFAKSVIQLRVILFYLYKIYLRLYLWENLIFSAYLVNRVIVNFEKNSMDENYMCGCYYMHP